MLAWAFGNNIINAGSTFSGSSSPLYSYGDTLSWTRGRHAFKLGGERYAVEVGAVFQVVDATGLNPLPAAPTWVLGAILARTRVVPVLDLRALLGLENGGMSDLAKIVVLEDAGDLFGVAVEDLEGRLDLEREKLASATDGPFAWIAPDRLAILDLSRIGAPSTPARGN